jgi:sugar phosphate isomerase/epimerase
MPEAIEPIRLCCGDWSFPMLEQRAAVQLVAQLGFGAIDLMFRGNSSNLRPEEVAKDLPGWAGRIDERVRGAGLDLADIFYVPWSDAETMATNHPDDGQQEQADAAFAVMLELATRLGIPGITLTAGHDWPNETHDDSLRRAAGVLGRRTAEARERGVRCSFEPTIGSVCGDPADVLRVLELAPGLELTLDYTHFVAQGYAESAIEPLVPYARHFHARGAAEGRLQMPLTKNTIDYERALDALAACDYSGFVTIEYIWTDWERLNEVDVVSETVILRDRLRAKLEGRPWEYPAVPV